MSQDIHNAEGELVTVLDEKDLTRFLKWALSVLFTVGLLGAWRVSAAVTDQRHEVQNLKVTVEENIPEVRTLRKTMDSLLVDLRVTRELLERISHR